MARSTDCRHGGTASVLRYFQASEMLLEARISARPPRDIAYEGPSSIIEIALQAIYVGVLPCSLATVSARVSSLRAP